MSEITYAVFCADCEALTPIVIITDEWLDGKPINGHYECAKCGKPFGIWMDGGMVDLGLTA